VEKMKKIILIFVILFMTANASLTRKQKIFLNVFSVSALSIGVGSAVVYANTKNRGFYLSAHINITSSAILQLTRLMLNTW
jgi:hypothetical protein